MMKVSIISVGVALLGIFYTGNAAQASDDVPAHASDDVKTLFEILPNAYDRIRKIGFESYDEYSKARDGRARDVLKAHHINFGNAKDGRIAVHQIDWSRSERSDRRSRINSVNWSAISKLSSLAKLDLSHNQLEGNVEWSKLPYSLTHLQLEHNMFSGPVNVTAMPLNLNDVSLYNNMFSGSIRFQDFNKRPTRGQFGHPMDYLDLRYNYLETIDQAECDKYVRVCKIHDPIATPRDALESSGFSRWVSGSSSARRSSTPRAGAKRSASPGVSRRVSVSSSAQRSSTPRSGRVNSGSWHSGRPQTPRAGPAPNTASEFST